MTIRRHLAMAAFAVATIAGPASAATYQVSTSGSDTNDGINAPFRTLSRAVRSLQNGDTVVFQPGTYAAGAYIEAANITLRGNGDVVLDGATGTRDDGLSFYQTSGIRLENLKIRGCRRMGVFVVLSSGLTVRNCELSGNTGSGLLTGNTSDVRIENTVASGNVGHGIYLSQSGDRLAVVNCRMDNNQRAGLQINAVQGSATSNPASDSISTDVLVEGNTLTGNGSLGGSAINLMSVRRAVIVNNLLANNLAGGISMWDDGAGSAYGCKDNRILHNTVVFASGKGRYGVQCLSGSTGNEITDNVLVTGSGPAIETDEAVRSDYNVLSAPSIANGGSLAAWVQSTGNDRHSVQANPGLGSDYKPASGSVCIDRGSMVYATDKDGATRPSGNGPDVGCFESGGAAPPPAPTPTPTPTPTPEPTPQPSGSAVIYDEDLAAGWSARRVRSSLFLGITNPVAQGQKAMSFRVDGTDGGFTLSGAGIPLAGKSVLRLMVHGGRTGGQQFRLRSIVDGVTQSSSLNLVGYGGTPKANGWIEYVVPLADLQATAGNLTGIKMFAGKKQKWAYLDCIRVE